MVKLSKMFRPRTNKHRRNPAKGQDISSPVPAIASRVHNTTTVSPAPEKLHNTTTTKLTISRPIASITTSYPESWPEPQPLPRRLAERHVPAKVPAPVLPSTEYTTQHSLHFHKIQPSHAARYSKQYDIDQINSYREKARRSELAKHRAERELARAASVTTDLAPDEVPNFTAQQYPRTSAELFLYSTVDYAGAFEHAREVPPVPSEHSDPFTYIISKQLRRASVSSSQSDIEQLRKSTDLKTRPSRKLQKTPKCPRPEDFSSRHKFDKAFIRYTKWYVHHSQHSPAREANVAVLRRNGTSTIQDAGSVQLEMLQRQAHDYSQWLQAQGFTPEQTWENDGFYWIGDDLAHDAVVDESVEDTGHAPELDYQSMDSSMSDSESTTTKSSWSSSDTLCRLGQDSQDCLDTSAGLPTIDSVLSADSDDYVRYLTSHFCQRLSTYTSSRSDVSNAANRVQTSWSPSFPDGTNSNPPTPDGYEYPEGQSTDWDLLRATLRARARRAQREEMVYDEDCVWKPSDGYVPRVTADQVLAWWDCYERYPGRVRIVRWNSEET